MNEYIYDYIYIIVLYCTYVQRVGLREIAGVGERRRWKRNSLSQKQRQNPPLLFLATIFTLINIFLYVLYEYI